MFPRAQASARLRQCVRERRVIDIGIEVGDSIETIENPFSDSFNALSVVDHERRSPSVKSDRFGKRFSSHGFGFYDKHIHLSTAFSAPY
jgi:transcription antitermination factor NusG